MPALLEQVVDGVRRLGEVVRWSEPWDIEEVDDPLYDSGAAAADETFDLWA